MPSLHYIVVVVTFILLASEVLSQQATFENYDSKMCPYNTEMRDIVRKNFTDTHNYRRSQLALGKVPNKNNHYLREASDMIKLEWDCWLERNATEYVRTCPYKESDETERSGIGELHARVPVEGDFKAGALAAVKRWWSIARKVSVDKCIGDDAKFGKELIGGEIKSFTQMAWAKTTKLGCAIGRCPNSENTGEDYVVVCRYYPKGNNEGENVYEPGPACGKCPHGYTCTTHLDCDQQICQGLCV